MKRFIAQQDLDSDRRFVPDKVIPKVCGDFEEKIAIIGGGPAGLSCAYYLAIKGYSPTIFEKERRMGGMLTNGIPSFRLEKDVVEAEIDVLKELGVQFRCGVEVGRDITIPELREQGFKGFYLAVGLQSGGELDISGADANGIISGIDFMRRVNLGDETELKGRVVVIGGGNIACDVARTAIRLGADAVDMYSLEEYEKMPCGEEDRGECERDGITIHGGWGPISISKNEDNCEAISFRKCLRVRDDEGRFAPRFDDNDRVTARCATIIYCIGQKVEWGEILEGTDVELNANGTVKADPVTYQTNEPDIFVGGDVYTGQKFAIDAIAAGKEGAVSLDRFVQPRSSITIGRDRRNFIEFNKKDMSVNEESFDNSPRERIGYNEALARTFKDERISFTEEQVKKETSRCLSCGASIIDENKCIGCGVCTTKCGFDAIKLHREHPECSKMVPSEEKMKHIIPYAIKQAVRVKIAGKKG